MAGKKQIGKGLAKALKLKKKKTGIQKGKPLLSGVDSQSRSDAMRGLAKRSTAATDALYSAQAQVRELAEKAGMRVKVFKQKNPNNTHVKTIDRILGGRKSVIKGRTTKKPTTTTKAKQLVQVREVAKKAKLDDPTKGARKQTGLDKAKARLEAKLKKAKENYSERVLKLTDAKPKVAKTRSGTIKHPKLKGLPLPEPKKKSTAPRAKAQAMLDEAKKSTSYQKALKDKTVISDLDKLSKSQFEKMLATDAGQRRLGKARMDRYFEKFDYYKTIDMNKLDSYADLKKSKKTYSRRKTKSKKK